MPDLFLKKNWFKFLILISLSPIFRVYGGLALSGSAGTSYLKKDLYFSYSLHGYYPLDEQTLIGIQGGQEKGSIPLLASLYLRLPVGGIILPVATADWGWSFGKDNSAAWKLGGGLDWKNGSRSSIILLGGYHRFGKKAGWYTRAGLLLEW